MTGIDAIIIIGIGTVVALVVIVAITKYMSE